MSNVTYIDDGSGDVEGVLDYDDGSDLVGAPIRAHHADESDPYYIGRAAFAEPGSALRRASKRNPRDQPCPTCKRENVLTRADKRLGYQCDGCADAEEGCY